MIRFLFSLLLIFCFTIINAQESETLNLEYLYEYDFYLEDTNTNPINDIWGYVDQEGEEYALVGLSTGFSIVQIHEDSLEEIQRIDGVFSIWRDIKTYGDYAFVVTEGRDFIDTQTTGLLVVDMREIEQDSIAYWYSQDNFTAHNIYIDENGIAYFPGGNGEQGTLFMDVTSPEDSIPILGTFNTNYLHDAYTRGDTMWGSAINNGTLQCILVGDKTNPEIIGEVTTPNAFCHNAWPNDEGTVVFTTDERAGAYVAAYDVSDPLNMQLLDKIQSFYSENTIPHNTHYYNGYLVTSYYHDGLQIVDAQYPNNLIDVGHYDSSPESNAGFRGCWGAYPYLPSEKILISDRQRGLIVLKPTYKRAGYVHLNIIDPNNTPISSATANDPSTGDTLRSSIFGEIKTGYAVEGTQQLIIEKDGYFSEQITFESFSDSIVEINVTLLNKESVANQPYSINQGMLTFYNTSSSQTNLQLYDLQGKLVFSSILAPNSATSIPESLSFSEGWYIARMSGEDTPTVQFKVRAF